jgi:oxygen-independent coproporphyrinogen-3 oxidase
MPPPLRSRRRASVYVHFPFCLQKCPYCDFVSYTERREAIDSAGYADAVLREMEGRAKTHAGELEIATVFFGGGTPSLWDPRELGRVLEGIEAAFDCASDLEVTVECNPTSLDVARANALARAGVNRLSIGTQSLRDDQLRFLGRLHDARGALAAIDAALASDVPRASTDLIFGLPEQAPEDARDQAIALAEREVAGRRLRHLSCYQLTIEPNTRFGELARKGRLPMADDARVAEAFLAIDEALGARGLAHYEVSNYAARGDEARHNLGYWRGEEYVGLGCGAYGMVRVAPDAEGRARAVRYRNATDPRAYVEAARDGRATTIDEEPLDAETMLRERIMLGLRVAGGFDARTAREELGVEPWTPARARAAESLAARGRVVRDGDRLFVPRAAWLWTDDTAARLF